METQSNIPAMQDKKEEKVRITYQAAGQDVTLSYSIVR
jgi:hypothetical protein